MHSTRTRTRSGCLPCRSRRRKCDERRPQCQRCEARGYICQWGLKASFHPSRSLRLSTPERAALLAIEKGRQDPATDIQNDDPRSSLEPSAPIIIDDTAEVVRYYREPCDGLSPCGSDPLHDESPLPNETCPGIPRADHVQPTLNFASHDSVRANANARRSPVNEVTIESLLSPTQSGSISDIGENRLRQGGPVPVQQLGDSPSSYALPFSLGLAASRNASWLPEPSMPITSEESARLFSLYLYETGTWCETTDSERHFTLSSVHQMMASKSFLASAIALASRQRDAVQDQPRPLTLELYQYTIQLLLRQDPDEASATVLATCTLLCVYEMMASCVWEWRRHLKGCASLLHSRKWNGSCSGIVKACFWAFARIDVWAAFISGKRLLIPTDSWVDNSSIPLVAANGTLDDYCNLAILVFARIVNLLADAQLSNRDSDPAYSSVGKLWDELQEWWRLRPKEACPLLREPSTATNPFPTAVFSRSSSICGNTFYHAGSILLLQSGCLRRRVDAPVSVMDPVWHARELGGISVSNISQYVPRCCALRKELTRSAEYSPNWVNQLQPLYIAGTAFSENHVSSFQDTSGRNQSTWIGSHLEVPWGRPVPSVAADMTEKYASEKIALLKQLARIEYCPANDDWPMAPTAGSVTGLSNQYHVTMILLASKGDSYLQK
ncbi:Zn(II)2Cys6 transcription factor [Aspergillus nidulans FGSC A4]|uniref:Zn(II)2Cys6 transcription factor (Eurofung) n=1 Tax=Emericella nidulans (strain FGSC A4 / ATCC 38163 / CBS 112.46 / NRRL 194 / M139) TaxID=227321 RepID=C8VH30_EMENI|nr:hypothetical protein [Aspergillus nidulans FGSC A4]CBF82226.1 TPA: Putative Zn(II)2Cys6 transcription factor (Eurofung) [Aspergillus nidulans FGSC A4]